ncbi:hypothetical protein [Ralstonia flatus]|uniref:hypothetical protein n=1 Tax=Ralstonia flatus TaxID=3058601 RepID=UPI00292F241D|nr:hypothetical protein [Ralstonia sp. LMG 32965]
MFEKLYPLRIDIALKAQETVNDVAHGVFPVQWLNAGAAMGANAPARPLLSSISSGRKTGPYGLQGHDVGAPVELAGAIAARWLSHRVRLAALVRGVGRLAALVGSGSSATRALRRRETAIVLRFAARHLWGGMARMGLGIQFVAIYEFPMTRGREGEG